MNQYTAPAESAASRRRLPAADPVRTTTYEYDGANDRVRETAADGAVTEYVYDSARKLVQITQRGSDDAALLARTTDAVPRVQTFEYDPPAGCSASQNADGTIETYAYDSANNKTQRDGRQPHAAAGRPHRSGSASRASGTTTTTGSSSRPSIPTG